MIFRFSFIFNVLQTLSHFQYIMHIKHTKKLNDQQLQDALSYQVFLSDIALGNDQTQILKIMTLSIV